MKFSTFLFIALSVICLNIFSVYSQQYMVKGKVTDEQTGALIGVNVLVKGTTVGTVTDNRGNYNIRFEFQDAVLVFSYVGYQTQEISVSGRTEINVVLLPGIEFTEIFVLGSRSLNRTITETPVPIDVINIPDLTIKLGQFDVNQILQYNAPSFNSTRQSGADGADHIDPATLRGLGPDQTLVLINGKRRHQSSLINIFGSRGRGNTGTDLNAIPLASIERIEILRDGASAQYGSDAIAGVVNVVLKSNINKLTGSVGAGVHEASYRTDRDYDGEEFLMNGNYGFELGENGFMNLSFDYLRKGKTNRPADPNVYDIYRRQFGDASLNNFGTIFNSRFAISKNTIFYAFGGLNHRYTDAFAWTREADSERNVPEIYPNGFDPRITSTIRDHSLSFGVQTDTYGWHTDFSNSYGVNLFHYYIDGTLNASLLEKSPTRFDAGGFELMQNTTSLDFTRFFNHALKGMNIAFGVEYRIDNYGIFAGEEGSWKNYGVIDTVIDGKVVQYDALGRPGGSQGFPGFRPENIVDEYRTNIGGYADIELDLTDFWMIGGAGRYEYYSDFGSTINGKFSTRFKVADNFAIRGSVGSGFRAPSLAQVYFNSTFTDFVSGVPVDKIIAKNNSPITRQLGIPALKEETAFTGSLGFTTDLFEGFTATVDGYFVQINDRVVLTGAFEDTDPDIGEELQALDVGAAQFFTNAIDTKTFGVDIILTYSHSFDNHNFRLSYAGNFNDMELGDIYTSPKLAGKEDVYFGRREQHFLLASAPKSKMNLLLDYGINRFHSSVQVTYFGKVILIDWLDTEDIYEAKITTDLSLGYDVTDNVTFLVGGANIFDEYPTMQDTETETGGLWDAVQMGFSGRFYYAKMILNF
jgi:iron complex outermembrane receptor protein